MRGAMLCLCLWVLGSSLALAEGETAPPMTPPSAPATSGTVSRPSAVNEPSLIMSVGPGLAIYSGDYQALYKSGSFGYALNASVMGQASSELPIYLGLDFGLDFWGFSTPGGMAAPGTSTDLNAVGVQFLPSAIYRFDMATAYNIYPYFGFSLGPHFLIFRQRTIGADIRSTSSTDVYFELLARPGANFQILDNVAVNFEPKFGVLNWQFIFLPQVNFVLSL